MWSIDFMSCSNFSGCRFVFLFSGFPLRVHTKNFPDPPMSFDEGRQLRNTDRCISACFCEIPLRRWMSFQLALSTVIRIQHCTREGGIKYPLILLRPYRCSQSRKHRILRSREYVVVSCFACFVTAVYRSYFGSPWPRPLPILFIFFIAPSRRNKQIFWSLIDLVAFAYEFICKFLCSPFL